MIIKEAYLESEKLNIKEFLKSFDLTYLDDANISYYIEEDDHIIGTISISDIIIKYLAVDKKYQSDNLATMLINKAIEYFRVHNITSYQVFTKPENLHIFESLGFKKIIMTNNVLMLEGGIRFIDEKIESIKKMLDIRFSVLDETSDIGCVVLNANPMTIGHEYLIETMQKRHKICLVFVVEENKSLLSFEERFSLVYLACKKYSNVYVIPSTKYIVSYLTFPTYFLKDLELGMSEYALVDALIFKEYFVKKLFIKKRYVGVESSPVMQNYNETLKNILGDKVEIIERLNVNGSYVSASMVRKLLKNNQINECLNYLPRETHMVFKAIAYGKRTD